jgi:hypothetical protein
LKRTPLLDVNVLVALFDPDHIHHEAAHDWFGPRREHGWATCPLSENGLVRVLSNPAYRPSAPTPGSMVERLDEFCASEGHVFWPDQISLRDKRRFHWASRVSHRDLTDVYLLALAMHHGGTLATFDRNIPIEAVSGAGPAELEIIPA